MKDPRELSNDDLAVHIEIWAVLNEELTDSQMRYFNEVIWRLRLMSDKEQEKISE